MQDRSSERRAAEDRAFVEAMRLGGEPLVVIEDFLMCLELNERERDALRQVAWSTAPNSAPWQQAATSATGR